MRHERPEHGACEAMSFAYNEPRPCSRKALYEIGERKLCLRHAQSLALVLMENDGKAVEIPNTRKPSGLAFVDEWKGGAK